MLKVNKTDPLPKTSPFCRDKGRAMLRTAIMLLEDNIDNIGAFVILTSSTYDAKTVHPDGERSDGFTVSCDIDRTPSDDSGRLGTHCSPACIGLIEIAVERHRAKDMGRMPTLASLFGG